MTTEKSAGEQKNWAAPFFTVWGGQAFSLLGSQLVQFSLIWWLTQKTGSATVLTTAMLVGLLPQVLLGPLAGTLVDRWNRRLVMIFADGAIALATVALALLFASGTVQIWHVYALMAIRSTAGGFHWSAMQASTSLMVPKQHLSRVQGINQMLNGALNIASAPMGAILLAVLPMQAILAIDVGTAALAITPLLFIAIPQPQRARPSAAGSGGSSVWAELRAGLSYTWGWPGLMIVLVMATLINFVLTPASALMPIMVTDHFGGGALQLGWIESGWGIGVVVGGLGLGAWGGFKRRIYTSLVGLIGLGAGSLLVGFTPASAFSMALAGMFFVGVMNPIVNGPLLAVVQAVVAPEMQGRVFTLIQSAAIAMTPIGLLIAGPVADAFGVQTWFILGGIVTASMGLLGFLIPAVTGLEDNHRRAASPTSELEPVMVNEQTP